MWASTISVDDLLHHTSGIPDYVTLLAERGVALDQVTTQDDAIEAVAAAQPNFPRGERWQYSNSNFILLAEIVQRVSGVDFAEFLADRVFAPLRLDAVLEPTKAVPDKAVGYLRIGEHWVPQVAKWEQYGDGSIQTTPRALVQWAAEYWKSRLLDRKTAALRLRGPAVAGEDRRYGTGIFVAGTEKAASIVLSHDGGWAGFHTTFSVIPARRLAVAVTCNTGQSGVAAGDAAGDVIRLWSRGAA